MAARIPRISSILSLIVNARVICYNSSHRFEICHIFEGIIAYLYIL
jgi:hypothetical protein